MELPIKTKRPTRVSRACENCRKKKIKCIGRPICHGCSKYGEPCIIRSQYRETKKDKHKNQSISNK